MLGAILAIIGTIILLQQSKYTMDFFTLLNVVFINSMAFLV